jgi:hypothetical protein
MLAALAQETGNETYSIVQRKAGFITPRSHCLVSYLFYLIIAVMLDVARGGDWNTIA